MTSRKENKKKLLQFKRWVTQEDIKERRVGKTSTQGGAQNNMPVNEHTSPTGREQAQQEEAKVISGWLLTHSTSP